MRVNEGDGDQELCVQTGSRYLAGEVRAHNRPVVKVVHSVVKILSLILGRLLREFRHSQACRETAFLENFWEIVSTGKTSLRDDLLFSCWCTSSIRIARPFPGKSVTNTDLLNLVL